MSHIPDAASLAYELLIASILGDLGFADARLAGPWARFWLCPTDDPGRGAAAARDLVAGIVAEGLPLSAVAAVQARLTHLEVGHLAAGGALAGAELAAWSEAAGERLVLLLAGVEGERVCASPATAGTGDPDAMVAALAQAADILNRSLGTLRAGAAPQSGRRGAA